MGMDASEKPAASIFRIEENTEDSSEVLQVTHGVIAQNITIEICNF
jgi:hypothetical protein